jgi:two-component system, cell cycle response regulator CtrA
VEAGDSHYAGQSRFAAAEALPPGPQSAEARLKCFLALWLDAPFGEEGVDFGKLNSHDLILLDLNLPDMSGYDVLRKLRQAEVQTPILILSGFAGLKAK